MMFWWSEDEESFLRSESCGMQSKALEKSMATAVVLAGGLSLLNPSAIAADSAWEECRGSGVFGFKAMLGRLGWEGGFQVNK